MRWTTTGKQRGRKNADSKEALAAVRFADNECIFRVAERCAEDYKSGHDVIVVLSAMGDTTDDLIAKAKEINPNPSKRELDMLLTTGEQISVSLMAMAFHKLGIPAVSLNAFQVKMHSTSTYGNARFKKGLILFVVVCSSENERIN